MTFRGTKGDSVKTRLWSGLIILSLGGCQSGLTALAPVTNDSALPASPALTKNTVPLKEDLSANNAAGKSDLKQVPVRFVQATDVELVRPPSRFGLPVPVKKPDGTQRPRELQPGAGEIFLPPPPLPPLPQGMQALQRADAAIAELAPISLESFEELACGNNPTLVQARAQIQATLGKAIQAGLWPNPRVFYIQEQIGVEGTPGEFLGAAVQQEIPTAHKLQLSRAKYLARTQVSEWVALEQEWQVLNDVRIHYFHTLGQQEITELQKELLKNSEDNLVTVREMYNVGQARRVEVHQANITLQQQRLGVLQAENDLRRSWQQLTALAGVDLPFTPLTGPLESQTPPIEWEQALGRIVAESPQVQQARIKLQGDRIQVERELVQPVPNVFVRAGAGENYEAKQAVGMVEVFMDVPLWDWNQGTIRQARSDLVRQQQEIRRVELDLKQQLARQYSAYLTALQQVRNYEQVILPESRQMYELLLDSYEDDRVRWLDVLEAEREYFLLRINYVNSLVALRESEVLIVGFLLHGGLMAPERPAPPEHIDVTPRPR